MFHWTQPKRALSSVCSTMDTTREINVIIVSFFANCIDVFIWPLNEACCKAKCIIQQLTKVQACLQDIKKNWMMQFLLLHSHKTEVIVLGPYASQNYVHILHTYIKLPRLGPSFLKNIQKNYSMRLLLPNCPIFTLYYKPAVISLQRRYSWFTTLLLTCEN